MKDSSLTHGSLFSGIGGFELGAKMSGIETKWNCEIEPYNRAILKQHFPESTQYDDIRTLSQPAAVDIISGGFPCQDISSAGRGKGITGERSGLWSEMYRVIDEVRPAYVVIENSPKLLQKGFEAVLYPLSEIGYDAEWQCLQASDFGLPHQRERVYVIAYANEIRCQDAYQRAGCFKKDFPWCPPGSPYKHLSTKWSDDLPKHSTFREFNELSFELLRIAALGNAVIPTITHYLFECIKQHANQ